MQLERVAFCGDVHIPYHDKKAWKLFIACIKEFRPNVLYFLGDLADNYSTSRHPKDPRRSRDLKVEVDAVNYHLDEIQSLGIERVHLCLGNHENNLERYLQERAPELFNLVNVVDLYKIEERGWTWSEYGSIVKYGKLHVVHDQDFAGNRAHEQTRAAIGGNVIIGHVHRLSVNYNQTLTGEAHVAVAGGWLGDAKYASYMKPSKRRDWHHGFTIGYKEPSGIVHLQVIPFIKNKALIEGQLITL